VFPNQEALRGRFNISHSFRCGDVWYAPCGLDFSPSTKMGTPHPTQTALPKSIGPTPTPLIIAAAFTLIAIAAVVLRFYSRRLKGAALLMDDWIILPALVSTCYPASQIRCLIACNSCSPLAKQSFLWSTPASEIWASTSH
jgi:hypothetical protein